MMKKLPVVLVLLFMATLMWSCAGNNDKKESNADSAKKEQAEDKIPALVSLNGFYQKDAIAMITDFQDNYYKKVRPRAKMSVWFSKETLLKMYNFLSKERGKIKADALLDGVTDGFRFYFVHEPSSSKDDLSVLMVATKYNEKKTAHDNYYHDPTSDPLFEDLDKIKGVKETGDCDGGALLHIPCMGDCPDNDCDDLSKKHKISRKNSELMTQQFGNRKINTRSVWFEYELLHNIVQNKVFNEINGIRLYFGNYGKFEYDLNRQPGEIAVAERKNRDSFIIMPTEDADGENNTKINRDKFTCETLALIFNRIYENRFIGYNYGELCPNHCEITEKVDK